MSDGQHAPRQDFGILLVTVARHWQKAISQALAQLGYGDATWMPLVRLYAEGENLTQVELSRRLGIDGSNLVRLLDQLSQRGLVERRPDPDDRRAHRLFLTDAGRSLAKDIRAHVLAIEDAMLGDIPDAELAEVNALLRKLPELIGKA